MSQGCGKFGGATSCEVQFSTSSQPDKNLYACVCVCACVFVCVCSPIATHYFPSLYHDKYELEDGYTVTGGAVRYGFNDREFPQYSWRGYAIYSRLQVTLIQSNYMHGTVID